MCNKIGAKVNVSRFKNANLFFRFKKQQAHLDREIDRKTATAKAFQAMDHLTETNKLGRVWSF